MAKKIQFAPPKDGGGHPFPVADIQILKSDTYLGNPQVRAAHTKYPLNNDQLSEILRCAQDPAYFIETYCRIVTLDHGIQPFKMFPYQREMVQMFQGNRFTLSLLARQMGKALDVDTKIPTPNGFKRMGDIEVGDQVIGSDGKPTNVTYVTEYQYGRTCYRVSFDDGSHLIADADHQWTVDVKEHHGYDHGVTLTTQDMVDSFSEGRFRIGNCKSVIDCGHSSDVRFGSHSARYELAANSNDLELVASTLASLGMKPIIHGNDITVSEDAYRYITSIEEVETRPVKCISVDAPDHLYLAGERFIPTHNTAIVAGYILWYITFTKHKEVAVLANKGDQAKEIMSRIRDMYQALPFFMQVGAVTYNKTSLEFDNGSSVFSAATSSSAIRGRSCVTGDTMVTVQGTDGIERDIEIYELLLETGPNNREGFRVLTHEGFKSFEGIVEHNNRSIMTLRAGRHVLRCTPDHLIMSNEGWRRADEIQIGDEVMTINGPAHITHREDHSGDGYSVYDLFEVDGGNRYFTDGILSHNCNLVYIDEAAFISNDWDFYESTYPTISSGETSRVIMTTTPKGARGMFYSLWRDSEAGTNTYVRYKADWSKHPKRDEKWKEETIGNIKQTRFSQEYELKFLGSLGALISTEFLERLQFSDPINDDESGTMWVYEEPKKGHRYVTIADPAGGTGNDNSACTVIDVTKIPYRQVAVFASNEISPLLFPYTITSIASRYNDSPLLIEANNDVGGQTTLIAHGEIEYPNIIKTIRDPKRGLLINAYGSSPGVKTTSSVKRLGCSTLKTLIENEKLIVVDSETIDELGTFIAKGNSYEADAECKDDRVMTLVLFSWLAQTAWFKDYAESNIVSDMMQTAAERGEEDTVVPFGHLVRPADDFEDDSHLWGGIPVTEGSSSGMADWFKN